MSNKWGALTTASQPESDVVAFLNSITPVSRETTERLMICHELLLRWQKKTNLVSPNSLGDFWRRHVADSLQLIPLAKDAKGNLPLRWVDMGSGGGFPGLVLAIVLADERAAGGPFHLTMIESIQKKCAFLRRVVSECNLPQDRVQVQVMCGRIESAPEQFLTADIITARALAPLDQLLAWTGPYLTERDGKPVRALFHKGRDYQREIEESRGSHEFDLIHHPSRIDPESVVLEISRVRSTDR